MVTFSVLALPPPPPFQNEPRGTFAKSMPTLSAGEGLPTEVVPEYRRARTIPERLAAMALAAARPGPLRRHLEDASIVHYPLTIAIPPVRYTPEAG